MGGQQERPLLPLWIFFGPRQGGTFRPQITEFWGPLPSPRVYLDPFTLPQGCIWTLLTSEQGILDPVPYPRVYLDPVPYPRVYLDPVHLPGWGMDPVRPCQVGYDPVRPCQVGYVLVYLPWCTVLVYLPWRTVLGTPPGHVPR